MQYSITLTQLALVSLIQSEHALWEVGNFGEGPREDSLLGIWEEGGELAHSILKHKQGIRGTAAEHLKKKVDAVGDILVYLISYCRKIGVQLADILSNESQLPNGFNPATNHFGIIKSTSDLIEFHSEFIGEGLIDTEAFDAVSLLIYRLAVSLEYYSQNELQMTAISCLRFAWEEVKLREWKVAPWNGVADGPIAVGNASL